MLGTMYISGEGVPKDYVKAKEYLEKADRLGIPEARELLEILHDLNKYER